MVVQLSAPFFAPSTIYLDFGSLRPPLLEYGIAWFVLLLPPFSP